MLRGHEREKEQTDYTYIRDERTTQGVLWRLKIPSLVFIITLIVTTAFVACRDARSLLPTLPYRFSRVDNPIAIPTASNTSPEEPLFHPPLHTSGRHILDASGRRFKLASLNYYGANDQLFLPGGLNLRHRSAIASLTRSLGFNSVRIPYSDQMVRENPMIPAHLLAANPDLVGRHALDVYTAVVAALTDAGLAVIINNHITSARWCCDANPCDALWFNDYAGPFCAVAQTEEDWIMHWETVMAPLAANPGVVGADLRNEVRGLYGPLGWEAWASAAERLSRRLHAIQPDWLMVVEGTASANDLSRALTRPVELGVSNRLVYSAHVYGWSGWGALDPYWDRDYDSFAADMHLNWGFLLEASAAPVWVGEFGAPTTPNEQDLNYWRNLMRYLERVDADFGYWALNPTKPKDDEWESYSLIKADWKTWRYDYRLRDLAPLMTNNSYARYEIQV